MVQQHTDSARADRYDGLFLFLMVIENNCLLCESLVGDGDIDDAIEDDLGIL